jgi:hypothetical protein
MRIRLALGFLLLAAPVWAEGGDLLAQEVDWAADESYASFDRADLDSNLHAMFYQADPDRFIFSLGAWYTRLTGPVKFDGGTKLDLSETLGLKARKSVPYVRAGYRLGWLEIVFEGFWYDNAGVQVVSQDFEIDGVEFTVGDEIDSDLKIHSYRLTLGFTATRSDWITLTFDLGFGAIWTEGNITAINVDKTARWDQWLPVPLIGVSIKGYFITYPWTYEAMFGWIGFSTDAFGAAAIDARLAFGYEFNDWVAAKVGYRFYKITADVEDVEVELELSGFYIEVAFMF